MGLVDATGVGVAEALAAVVAVCVGARLGSAVAGRSDGDGVTAGSAISVGCGGRVGKGVTRGGVAVGDGTHATSNTPVRMMNASVSERIKPRTSERGLL